MLAKARIIGSENFVVIDMIVCLKNEIKKAFLLIEERPDNFLVSNYANTFLQRWCRIILWQRFIHIHFLTEVFIINGFGLNKKKPFKQMKGFYIS